MTTESAPDTDTDTEPDTVTDTDTTERARQLIGLLAEESRLRTFAAVALGADSPERIAETAGLPAKDTALALLRLREQGVVTADGARGGLAVSYGLFRGLARRERPAARSGDGPDAVLDTFVRDRRLVRLPAQWTRKKLVLRHIAEQTFEPGVEYPERVVNERLRAWCEDSDEIDHVTLRRYLVDLHHLHRSEGIYRRPDVG
ncbi:DUF2087 domain-containing protein [Streptomyces sp. Ag109_G2-15]|uniref:DUF2087 domain-containing protein n=1 Tax=Streptomyces sp. Ag109_G2-15 TaxID=1938850 RepID=UPI000BC447CE|nr:DUF2087 domain-containing protein [Streptomyces sp. Ag109_G2-15]SOD86485.1 hypothetical protein SAMN06272765_3943 [Streptomyces sp. Ag109_G2-15]